MVRKSLFFIVTLCWALMVADVSATETNNILSKIEHMASLDPKNTSSSDIEVLGDAIAEGIEKNPAVVFSDILPRLKNKNLTENQLMVYVWVLGLTKNEVVVSAIKQVHEQSKSDSVRYRCLDSLAMVGGKDAGEFLLSALDATTDKKGRYYILNLLAQMQYEEALPRTEEILKTDIRKYYWQPIFIFGKMGDKAVPFLLKRLSDKDRNIRANSINVLGRWLIPLEAAKPLQDRFWIEKDTELRSMILSSLEIIVADFTQMKAFFEQVVAKESDKKLLDFARETLSNMDQMKDDVSFFAQKKKHPSSNSFQHQYEQLFKSGGKRGNYEVLETSSTVQDEAKLKALRERILQRDSDEALYDYQKVNDIIIRNRFIKKTIDQ